MRGREGGGAGREVELIFWMQIYMEQKEDIFYQLLPYYVSSFARIFPRRMSLNHSCCGNHLQILIPRELRQEGGREVGVLFLYIRWGGDMRWLNSRISSKTGDIYHQAIMRMFPANQDDTLDCGQKRRLACWRWYICGIMSWKVEYRWKATKVCVLRIIQSFWTDVDLFSNQF